MAQLENVLKDFVTRLSSIENQLRNPAASVADVQTIPAKTSVTVALPFPSVIVKPTPTSEPVKTTKATGQAIDPGYCLLADLLLYCCG